MKTLVAACAAAAMLCATSAMADTTVFQDNFDSEAGGTQLNYTGFANWTISDGTVDLIANGGYGIQCVGGAGVCVDMDGTSDDAGVMTSSALSVGPGTYVLSFDYSGNQRGGADDSINIAFGSFTDSISAIHSTNGYLTYTSPDIVIGSATSLSIVLGAGGGDDIGPILDNVKLTEVTSTVPEPVTWSLMIVAFAGLAYRRRLGLTRA